MIKKIVVTFLFLFSANYSQDCPVKPTGLTVCEKKMDKTFVSIELEKTRRETSKACFPYWDGYSFPDISIKLSVDGNIIFFPKELYCTIALVNDFSVKKETKTLFYLVLQETLAKLYILKCFLTKKRSINHSRLKELIRKIRFQLVRTDLFFMNDCFGFLDGTTPESNKRSLLWPFSVRFLGKIDCR